METHEINHAKILKPLSPWFGLCRPSWKERDKDGQIQFIQWSNELHLFQGFSDYFFPLIWPIHADKHPFDV